MTLYVDNIEFKTQQCCNCHMVFGTTKRFELDRRNDRKTFYCPQGHPQAYTAGQDEASVLRREVERQKELREAEQARLARVEKEKGQLARAHMKMRTRVMNGVCPCCNRTFQNLLRHMQTEHEGQLTLKSFREAYGMTQTALAHEIGVKATYVSAHERGAYLPDHAKRAIDVWVISQEATPSHADPA